MSPTRSRRSQTGFVLLSVVTLCLVAGVSASAGPVRGHATSNGWTQLSNGKISTIQSIGIARFGSAVQAVWVQETAGNSQTLYTRIVGGNGTASSAATVATPAWRSLTNFPVILESGGKRVIAFSGLQNTDTQNPYSLGYEYYLTSTDGASWSLSTGALSSSPSAYGSYGTDAVDVGGTPVVGYTVSSANAVSYHSGFITAIPTTPPGADPTTSPATPCCVYDTGLGTDAATGKTWAVWASNSGKATTDGILAQPITPALGALTQAPKSTAAANGSYSSPSPGQRIVTSSRVGGGVYAAYVIGYPSPDRVALWKLGSSSPIIRSAGGNVQRVGTAAGPDGRIWLYWRNAGSHTIEVARTNPGANRLGAVCHVTTPGKAESVWDLVGDASNGPLQLFTLAGDFVDQQVYDRVIKPCLTVTVSPHAISAANGGTVTVSVSDAGAAISGAQVSFDGQHRTTSSAGIASFKVAKGHKSGTFSVTVGEQGYQEGSASVRIR